MAVVRRTRVKQAPRSAILAASVSELVPDTPRHPGWFKTTHGGKGTRLYSIWKNMRRRCLTATHPDYPRYGGRGIRICKRWDDFSLFRLDMGEPPTERHTLERQDVNSHYCPENCTWATKKEQARNTTKTRWVVVEGIRMSLAEACEIKGLNYKRVHGRLTESGMSLEDAMKKGRYK